MPISPAVGGGHSCAVVFVDIPETSLKEFLCLSLIKKIGDQTGTLVLPRVISQRSCPTSVRFRISGKWRDCYSAARLLWYRLTQPFTAHVHGSWASNARQPYADLGNQSLETVYQVSLSGMRSVNVLLLTGAYWNVIKMRRQLIIRQHIGNQGSCALHLCANPVLSDQSATQAGLVLASIQRDLRSKQDGSGQQNSLELLQLLFGNMSIESQEQRRISICQQPAIGGSLPTIHLDASIPRLVFACLANKVPSQPPALALNLT